ncbi:MAG: carboxymuconolactone decarboxylase family protein [Ferruginibacter sp.]|nr:carboxymuconolactone decarboxylase family protein [Ferruginibacter sp.]
MNKLKCRISILFFVFQICIGANGMAQKSSNNAQSFDKRERQIVAISSLTAKGDLVSLNQALHGGLDSGLTINEIKEVLVHLYAYTGFPRSLQGLNTLIAVLNDRKAKGIKDNVGRTASPVSDGLSRYERGKQVLETLTGQKESANKTGYAALSPEVEVFLKEHLFADLFTRDVISYADRELATISALINLGGVEPMMQSHMRIALNIGFTQNQLSDLISVIEHRVGMQESEAGRKGLQKVAGKAEENQPGNKGANVYAKGVKAPPANFTGTVWVNMLVLDQEDLDVSIGSVTFEPGARTNWHRHPGGQILLVTEGKGYYQERGKPLTMMQKGDVIKCLPGTEHWHGASPGNKLTHIAIGPNTDKGNAVWLERVTDEEYKNFK